jgi:hypothetical protein
MHPKLFDVRANDLSNAGVPVLKPWKRIPLDPETAGAWIVAGDVDGDGQVEIVFESINVGKVCPDVPGQQIVVDIDHRPRGESPLWVLDREGDLLGQIITDGSRHHALTDWFGQGLDRSVDSIVMGTAAALFDCAGNRVALFDAPKVGLVAKGDVTGNGVPDLVFSSNPASEIALFRNEQGKPPRGGAALGTGVNYTLY